MSPHRRPQPRLSPCRPRRRHQRRPPAASRASTRSANCSSTRRRSPRCRSSTATTCRSRGGSRARTSTCRRRRQRRAQERERYIRDGLAVVDEAARAKWADSGEIFKWHGRLLGALSDFVGTKEEKVTNALIVRESLERAAPLLPDDATVQTALGQWCTKVASMNVLQRNAAKLLFGPLEATHEEALAYYTRANELRTEKRVLIKLAETHLALSQRGDAKAWPSAQQSSCPARRRGGRSGREDRRARRVLTFSTVNSDLFVETRAPALHRPEELRERPLVVGGGAEARRRADLPVGAPGVHEGICFRADDRRAVGRQRKNGRASARSQPVRRGCVGRRPRERAPGAAERRAAGGHERVALREGEEPGATRPSCSLVAALPSASEVTRALGARKGSRTVARAASSSLATHRGAGVAERTSRVERAARCPVGEPAGCRRAPVTYCASAAAGRRNAGAAARPRGASRAARARAPTAVGGTAAAIGRASRRARAAARRRAGSAGAAARAPNTAQSSGTCRRAAAAEGRAVEPRELGREGQRLPGLDDAPLVGSSRQRGQRRRTRSRAIGLAARNKSGRNVVADEQDAVGQDGEHERREQPRRCSGGSRPT